MYKALEDHCNVIVLWGVEKRGLQGFRRMCRVFIAVYSAGMTFFYFGFAVVFYALVFEDSIAP